MLQYAPSIEKLNKIKEKWKEFLKPFDNDSHDKKMLQDSWFRRNLAITLDNQHMAQGENLKVIRESTTSGTGFPSTNGDIDKFPNWFIPLVRRIMPQLIANEIFAVQPLEGPVGMAFSMRWVYDSTKSWTDPETGRVFTTTAGDEAYIPGTYSFNPAYTGDNSATSADNLGWATDKGEALSDIDVTPGGTFGNVAAYPYTDGSLKILNKQVQPTTRKMRAEWSQEAVDDIKKVHSIDLEGEMVDFLTYQIQAEIDRQLIAIAYRLGTQNGMFVWDLANADGRWQEEKYKTLYHAISKSLNYVGLTTRRGRANWMIVSSEVASMLSAIKAWDYSKPQVLDGFEPYTQGEGIVYLGTLENGSVKVYLDLYWQAPPGNPNKELGYILMGYKGKKSWDSGIIYAPYIPIMMVKTISPHNFHPLLSIGSRYGIISDLLDTEKYYSVISVRNTAL